MRKDHSDHSLTEHVQKHLFQTTVEALLEAEMDEFLARNSGQNARSGSSKKHLSTQLGKVRVAVPQDKRNSFEPRIIKRRRRSYKGPVDDVIALPFLRVGERERALRGVYQKDLSFGFISSTTKHLKDRFKSWKERPFKNRYRHLFFGEFVLPNSAVIVYCADEGEEVLSIWQKGDEELEFWRGICAELRDRGVMAIECATLDAPSGLGEVLQAVYPEIVVEVATEELPEEKEDREEKVIEAVQAAETKWTEEVAAESERPEQLAESEEAEVVSEEIPEELIDQSSEELIKDVPAFVPRTAPQIAGPSMSFLSLSLLVFLLAVTGVYYASTDETAQVNVAEQSEEVAELGDRELVALVQALPGDKNVLRRSIRELGNRQADTVRKALVGLSDHPHFSVRVEVVKALAQPHHVVTDEGFQTLATLLADQDYIVRGFAAKVLGSLEDERAVAAIKNWLPQETNKVVAEVLEEALNV